MSREHDRLLAANAAFYEAFANRDVDAIDALWAREAEVAVAYLAAKADAVEPMRKDYRPHPGIIRILVDHDVAVFGFGPLRQRIDRHNHDSGKHGECES